MVSIPQPQRAARQITIEQSSGSVTITVNAELTDIDVYKIADELRAEIERNRRNREDGNEHGRME